MASFKITQANGSQGSTNIGPKATDKVAPAGTMLSNLKREITLQLDGSVAVSRAYDGKNDETFAFPKGSMVLEAVIYSQTGVAALNVGTIDSNAAGSDTNLLAGVNVPGVNWLIARDLDLTVGEDSELVFSGLGVAETAEVTISYYTPVAQSRKGGVLSGK